MPRQLRSRRQRRGVLILVVLSLLVMFVLVAVAFVISAGQHRTAARAASRHDLTGTPPQQQLDDTMRQLVRGTTNAASAFQDADLLGDVYGAAADGASGTLAAAPASLAGGQLLTLTTAALPNTTPEFYSGRVLTFIDGQAKNVSTRIVGNPNSTTLRVLALNTTTLPASGDKFRINGRAFSGVTLGTNPNEDYDAVDNYNPFLSAIDPAATPNVTPAFDRTAAGGPTKRVFGALDPSTDPWDVDNDGDGVFDSIWIDAGFPVEAAADGRLYKALVAVLCLDLDGRLNLNAHGGLSTAPAAQNLVGGASTSQMPRGEGYGPAEISLAGLLGGDYANYLQGTASIPGRYGANGTLTSRTPGVDNTYDDLAKLRLFQYPQNFSTTTLSAFGSPANLQGNLAFGLGVRGELIYDGVNTTQLTDSPYEINLSQNAPSGPLVNTADAPYSLAEFERILRPFDVDTRLLPSRLVQLASSFDIISNRHKITTHSFDQPVYGTPPGGTDLATQLAAAGYTLGSYPSPVAPEMLLGLPMDLNRPFGNGLDDNGNFVVDEEDEISTNPSPPEKMWTTGTHQLTQTGYTNVATDRNNDGAVDAAPTNARQLYAQQLYTLLSLLYNSGGDATIARTLAQWAVNVVDFRDADSIMTKFDYDPAPLTSGWSATDTVWGCERPELLITETLAFHDRRTEDLDTADNQEPDPSDPGGPPAPDTTTSDADNPDDDYDQKVLPRSAFYVELYNPWPIGSLKAPGELYDSGGNGVQLGKTSAVGNSPVWRMIVVRGASKGKDPEDPNDPVVNGDVERTIFFTTGGGSPLGKAHYAAAAGGNLPPGRYAVIGTTGTSMVGDRNDANPTDVRRIVLSANDVAVYNDSAGTVARDPAALPVAPLGVQINNLSVSEPTGLGDDPDYTTYGTWDGTSQFNPPVDVPIDKTRSQDNALDLEAIWSDDPNDGEAFRWIYLQRLANPLAAYDATNNPYLTVDAQPINLTSFNGVTATSDPGLGVATGLSTHQRGVDDAQNTVNIWRRDGAHAPPASNAGTGLHHFDYNINHSLGYINLAYNAASPPTSNDPTTPFPWLAWNNRPFVSQFELMQVPFVRSSQLTEFHNAPQNASEQFAYLLDFSSAGTFYKMFDYLHVPSRFASAQQVFNPATFAPGAGTGVYPFFTPHNRISKFRDPGKINVNTIFHEEIWNGLMHIGGGMMAQPGPSWPNFQASRAAAPFRSFNGGAVANSLMRDSATPNTPLFNGASANPANDTNRNSYFRHQALVRLPNLVTTRSNVFAVWITLGYFEIDPATGNLAGIDKELGADSGDIQRHRAFYLIDRTIPVGYDPGKNLNVDDAVLLRRFIE